MRSHLFPTGMSTIKKKNKTKTNREDVAIWEPLHEAGGV